MSKRISIGVVGCGYWGPNLIRNFLSIPDVENVIACDTRPERAKHIKNTYHIDCVENFEELLKNHHINAIAIATPVSSHYELAARSLEHGKHTYVEKPMCRTSSQCIDLIHLAEKNHSTLMVGHTFIYSLPIRIIKEIVDSGDIGELLYICSHRLNLGIFQKDINVVWDLAPHDLSIILYIMNEKPVSVNCQGKSHKGSQHECVTNMSLNFMNGSFAIILSSWIDPNKVRKMTFVGSKKMIVFDDNEPLEKIKIYDKRVECPKYYDTFGDFQYSYHYGDMYSPHIEQVEPIKIECQHFIDCINTGHSPLSSGFDGLQVVQILEAASKSLNTSGSKVELVNLYEVNSTYPRDSKLLYN